MNVPRFSFRSHPATAVLSLGLASMICCLPAANAARPGRVAGLRMLQAQLPAGASLRRQDCEHLAKAVHAATLAHRKDAVTILSAALTLDEWDARRKEEDRLSCPCVSRLFLAAVSASPDAAATLLETAQALYPDCADTLATALRELVTSHQVAVVSRDGGPNDSSPDGHSTGTGGPSPSSPAGTVTDGGAAGATYSSPDGSDTGAGAGSIGGLGGFGGLGGAGFPGAPGFSGSGSGGGGVILPSPVSTTTTPF